MNPPIKLEPVAGFPEWLPGMCLIEERILHTIRQQFQLYGFAPIETPAVERMEVLKAKGGMQRQIYTLGRPEEIDEEASLGLHFDLTVPLARYVAQHKDELVFPFRRYQIQKVWRGERPQRGRFREFYQCDIDIVGRGSLDLIHDAEIPCVIEAVFNSLELPDFRVNVSNRKVLTALFEHQGLSSDMAQAALRAIDKSERDGVERTGELLKEEGLSQQLISTVLSLSQCDEIDDARQVLNAVNAPLGGLDELAVVIQGARDLGMRADRVRPRFSIVRGLDYYTGTIYETFVSGKEDWGSICSGGRYDDLASYFTSQRLPGVGISIGLTRLIDLLVKSAFVTPASDSPTQLLVTMQDRERYMPDYLGLARTLRNAGLRTEVYLEPHSLREQVGYAVSRGIPYVIIAGGNEFDDDRVTVRDIRHHSQETIHGDELVRYVRDKLGSQ